MSNPSVPTKVSGDPLDHSEINAIVTAFTSKMDIGTSVANSIIDLKAAGVVDDGTTDNSTVLMNLRTANAGAGKPFYHYILPPGKMVYVNPRWTFGIHRLHLWGAADMSHIATIYNGTNEYFQRPINAGDIFSTNTLSYTGGNIITDLYRFRDVTAGSITITMWTTAEVSNVAVGKRLWLCQREQIGTGYPLGTRDNEIVTIKSISGGVLTLETPIKYTYRNDTWDVPEMLGTGKPSGKPRFVVLDRADYTYPYYFGVTNVVFDLPNGAAAGAASTFQPIAETVRGENIISYGNCWPAMCMDVKLKNLKMLSDPSTGIVAEFDKMGGKIELEDCYFSIPVSNGTGWKSIKAVDTYFGEGFGCCSQEVELTRCTLRAGTYPSNVNTPLGSAPAATPIKTLTIEDLTFLKKSGNTAPEAIEAVAHGSYTVTNVSGKDILVPFISFTDNTTMIGFVYPLLEGSTRLRKADGTKGGVINAVTFNPLYNPTVRTGTITATTTSKTITGAGTNFTGQLAIGSNIISGGVYLGQVASITSNTVAVLADNSEAAATAAAYSTGQGAILISGSWNVAPVAGEVWQWRNVENFVNKGGHKNVANFNPLFTSRSMLQHGKNKDRIRTIRLSIADIAKQGSQVCEVRGALLDYYVHISKANNSTDSGASLFFATNPSFDTIATINMKIAGTRHVNQFVEEGAVTGDNLDQTKFGVYHDKVIVIIQADGAPMADQSLNSVAEGEIFIKVADL